MSVLGNYLAYEHLEDDSTNRWGWLGGLKFPTGD
jgi:hypothetical protein